MTLDTVMFLRDQSRTRATAKEEIKVLGQLLLIVLCLRVQRPFCMSKMEKEGEGRGRDAPLCRRSSITRNGRKTHRAPRRRLPQRTRAADRVSSVSQQKAAASRMHRQDGDKPRKEENKKRPPPEIHTSSLHQNLLKF